MEEPTVSDLRRIADLYGLPWSDRDLALALPAVTSALELLSELDRVDIKTHLEPLARFQAT